jgi:hypothetical protein
MADFRAKVLPRMQKKKKYTLQNRLQLEQEDQGYTNMYLG